MSRKTALVPHESNSRHNLKILLELKQLASMSSVIVINMLKPLPFVSSLSPLLHSPRIMTYNLKHLSQLTHTSPLNMH